MKAMILAAGRGERMRPLTDHCPKPLLPAGGKPLLQWHIEALAAAGIHDIVVNHAHLGQQIEDHFGDGSALGVQLGYSAEATALETAGGIRKALPLLGNKPFLVINGDVACEWPVPQAVQIADAWRVGQLAHLVMVHNPVHNLQGDFALENGLVKQPGQGETAFTFSGIGVYHPDLFEDIEIGQVAKLAPLLREAMSAGKVQGELFTGFWMDIGTPERLEELNQRLNSGRTN
ncbi:N-acetylmuramate alpha-1-phosphate uridylyltransferase MurU [Limnobacter parvus]|uniref:Nucleotidyltransferase family protein n=1 Tax=Limnobacter parvus TaxID=2939690 RepID=A0ABT1XG58_9BURK|nr:nucleotidyltransferase family protein [Limnobacter parvus]MCR2746263.1 nucleotidyltransferase family protein [Limnobacter parvus]